MELSLCFIILWNNSYIIYKTRTVMESHYLTRIKSARKLGTMSSFPDLLQSFRRLLAVLQLIRIDGYSIPFHQIWSMHPCTLRTNTNSCSNDPDHQSWEYFREWLLSWWSYFDIILFFLVIPWVIEWFKALHYVIPLIFTRYYVLIYGLQL